MVELIKALQKCEKLRSITVNDNWLKAGATIELLKLVETSKNLQVLNVSDCNMGQENVIKLAAALKSGLTHFMCNYNECENRSPAALVLTQLAALGSLKNIDFIGNVESRKFNKAVKAEFSKRDIALRVFEDEGEDQDEQEDDSDDEDFYFKLPEEVAEPKASVSLFAQSSGTSFGQGFGQSTDTSKSLFAQLPSFSQSNAQKGQSLLPSTETVP